MAIRAIFPKDQKAISNLFRQLYPNQAAADVDLTAESFEAEYFPFCVEEGGQVIGLIVGTTVKYGTEKCGYIDELVVEESKRGQGVGSRLVEYLLDRFKSRGATVAFVSAGGIWRAVGFYESLGFQECKSPWLFRSLRNPVSEEES